MAWPLTRYEIVEGSMSPTFEPGDYVLARRRRRPDPGDVVVFRGPVGSVVKRVVAIGPATVTIDGGVVLVDGTPFTDPWPAATRPDGAWDVPDSTVFVLGDHRQRSESDSRQIGSIPLDDIEAVVVGRYWPLRR